MSRTLPEALTDPAARPRVVEACAALVDAEVAARRGLTGIPIRTGYAAVKAMKPTMVRDALDALLPDMAAALEPFRVESAARGEAFEQGLVARQDRVAEALLAVTDRRIAGSTNAALKRTYGALRGLALGQVRTAVPGIARTLAPFI